jgi:hypothetical protein
VTDNTDQIIAHVELLRAVEQLLAQADIVRQKRATLIKSFAQSAECQIEASPDSSAHRRRGLRGNPTEHERSAP